MERAERGEPLVGLRPGDRDLGRAAARQAQELGDLPARQAEAGRACRQGHGRGERRPRDDGRLRELDARHLRLRRDQRQPDGPAPLEVGERLDDEGPRASAVEGEAGAVGSDRDAEPATAHGRVDGGAVDRPRDAPDRVREDRRVDGDLGRDVRAEELRLDPADAADRREAVTGGGGAVHGALPVRPHAELGRGELEGAAAREERDRPALERGGPPCQRRRRVVEAEPAHLHAGDRRPGREARRGACDDCQRHAQEQHDDADRKNGSTHRDAGRASPARHSRNARRAG